jgi:hypothetical protein
VQVVRFNFDKKPGRPYERLLDLIEDSWQRIRASNGGKIDMSNSILADEISERRLASMQSKIDALENELRETK